MNLSYPTFITKYKKDFLVYIPDFDLYTEGSSFENAIEMAKDAIELQIFAIKNNSNKKLPKVSNSKQTIAKAKLDTEDFDYSKGNLVFIDVLKE